MENNVLVVINLYTLILAQIIVIHVEKSLNKLQNTLVFPQKLVIGMK